MCEKPCAELSKANHSLQNKAPIGVSSRWQPVVSSGVCGVSHICRLGSALCASRFKDDNGAEV
jgi:hypothetical protein